MKTARNGRLAALARPDFGRFFTGYATSALGASMSSVAIACAVLDEGGTATDLGIVFAAGIVPQVCSCWVAGSSRAGRRPAWRPYRARLRCGLVHRELRARPRVAGRAAGRPRGDERNTTGGGPAGPQPRGMAAPPAGRPVPVKKLLELVICLIHPLAVVLMWIDLVSRTDLSTGAKLAWAIFGLIPLVPFLYVLTGGDLW